MNAETKSGIYIGTIDNWHWAGIEPSNDEKTFASLIDLKL